MLAELLNSITEIAHMFVEQSDEDREARDAILEGAMNQARRPCARARVHRDMQPEAHRIENIENSREVCFFWIARKGTMNARPRKPRYLRKVRDIVQTGGGRNGVINFGDIRLLKGLIYAIGCGPPLAQVWSDGFFRHVTSKQIGRHFCRPTLLETT
jgi:hypothetical protein